MMITSIRKGLNRDIDLFDFLDLREYLENRLSNKVDLVMESALKPAIGNVSCPRSNMSKGREIYDYLDDIVTAIADTEEFTLCRHSQQAPKN